MLGVASSSRRLTRLGRTSAPNFPMAGTQQQLKQYPRYAQLPEFGLAGPTIVRVPQDGLPPHGCGISYPQSHREQPKAARFQFPRRGNTTGRVKCDFPSYLLPHSATPLDRSTEND